MLLGSMGDVHSLGSDALGLVIKCSMTFSFNQKTVLTWLHFRYGNGSLPPKDSFYSSNWPTLASFSPVECRSPRMTGWARQLLLLHFPGVLGEAVHYSNIHLMSIYSVHSKEYKDDSAHFQKVLKSSRFHYSEPPGHYGLSGLFLVDVLDSV